RVACLLQCIPRPWDCSYDSDCESGRCELVVCAGAAAPPCDPADANCDPAERPAMPEPACWGYCADPGPGECGANGECPAGYHCGCGWPADGSATDIACYPMCVPDDPDPGHCTSNADCGDHEYCGCGPGVGMQNGLVCNLQCLPEPYDCSQNSDCESGVCNFEICSGAADPMPCDGDGCANRPAPPAECKGYCAPPDEPIMCDLNGQCPDGYHCGCGNPFQGSGGGMPNGIACYLQCVPDGDPGTCNGDGDCRDGQHCVITAGGGWCVDDPADQCMDDRDCAANQHCERDVCPAAPCTYDEATGEVVCPPCYGTCQDDPTPTTCQRTGCSGQVCAAEPVYTTCEWREYYQCFQLATCGANDAGACGWQGNDAFRECMQAHGGPASF
ncbi:MAG: hypothetical protein KC635_25490, partial [Myxococcales bacterium]|nr:hypothetical protein [Myxococcales bacterium]